MSSVSSDLLGCCGMGAKPRPLDSRLIVSRERGLEEVLQGLKCFSSSVYSISFLLRWPRRAFRVLLLSCDFSRILRSRDTLFYISQIAYRVSRLAFPILRFSNSVSHFVFRISRFAFRVSHLKIEIGFGIHLDLAGHYGRQGVCIN